MMITTAESAEAACQGWLKLIWSPDTRIQNVMSRAHIGNSLMIINGGWAEKSFRLSVALQQEKRIIKLPMWAVGEDISQNHHMCILCVWCLVGLCVLRLQCVFCTTHTKPERHILSPWNNGVVDGKWSLTERLAELSIFVFMYFHDPQRKFARKIKIVIGIFVHSWIVFMQTMNPFQFRYSVCVLQQWS